jgi:NADH-quinone oxidoreductase subunit L
MNLNAQLALWTFLCPALAVVILAVIYPLRRSGKPAAYVSILGIGISTILSVWNLILVKANPVSISLNYHWLPGSNGTLAYVGFWLDSISAIMLLVVSGVALAVQVYSLGYMSHETKPSLGRYYLYHSLFATAMLGLVLANNLLEVYLFWELVGVCSYLLIGFWYYKPEAARAAVKAFWVTRFGDMGLIIGIILLWGQTGTFDYQQIFGMVQAGQIPLGLLTLASVLMLMGAFGKSAQFPFHVWLPDAMEGPTPVSALIHAATMVAAGVYLVIRLFPIFEAVPLALNVLTYVGSFTALLAATLATRQADIKKVLAYSTVSQLGFMMAALGVTAQVASYFHLFNHAFFKALLFLGAGSVIHAVGSNNFPEMGNLSRKMKVTSTVFMAGGLALAGIWPFSGFFSKDEILVAVGQSGKAVPLFFLLLTTFLTAFYIFRAIFLAFYGPKKAEVHAHESPKVMTLPMGILAGLSLVTGWFAGDFEHLVHPHLIAEISPSPLPWISLGLALSGVLVAWVLYQKGRTAPAALTATLSPLSKAIDKKYWLDDLYEWLYAKILLAFSGLIGWIDRYLVDGVVNLSAWLTGEAGSKLRLTQTGKAQDYLIGVTVGLMVLIILGLGLR